MKLNTLIATAGVALALIVPAAMAATVKAAPHQATVTHHKVVTIAKKTAPDVVYTAPFGPNPIHTPIYIYLPGGTPDPNAMPVVDCTTSPDGCTDPVQLCTYWGEC